MLTAADIMTRDVISVAPDMTVAETSELLTRYRIHGAPVVDAAGQPIAFQAKTLSEKVDTPFGRTTVETLYADLGVWFHAEKVSGQDYLLFTLVDWEKGVIQLEGEPFSQHDPDQHTARNRLLADLFYELLESASSEDIYAHEAVPTVYARLPDKRGYPPDHWMIVLAADGRMTSDGWRIHYSDSGFSMLEQMVREYSDEPGDAPSQPVSKAQGARVYHFRAALARRPKLWRTLEIQGKHSLVDLDRALRKDLGRYQKHIEGVELVDYKVRILTGGTDAVTRVLIESRDGEGNRWFTVGVSPNIVDASFEALIDSINYKLIRDGATAP